MMTTDQLITPDLISRFDLRVPRYTSYPTVPAWNNDVKPADYIQMLKDIGKSDPPLSIYVHIPFCIRRCLFCACNMIVTKKEERAKRYLRYLLMEIEKTAEYVGSAKQVIQLHLGGGTPTHLKPDQLDELFIALGNHFDFAQGAEKSIEVHPSVTTAEHIDVLKEHGFNRISMGVQDFDPVVQAKLNRHQTYEETVELIELSRSKGFQSVNVDLIYGLPYQTPYGFEETINQILDIRPDRIAMYSYAHLPNVFKHHKGIPLEVVAQGEEKLNRFLTARKMLLDNGYQQIGFDHFSTTEEELWQSYVNKTLRRNFMGFTTKAGTDLIAFGYSGISELTSGYAQNSKDMHEYEALVEKYGVATVKGHRMSSDDKTRKTIIMKFLYEGDIVEQGNEAIIEKVKNYLDEYVKIGFLERTEFGWAATALGRIFSRVVASSFDKYYDVSRHLFSKSI